MNSAGPPPRKRPRIISKKAARRASGDSDVEDLLDLLEDERDLEEPLDSPIWTESPIIAERARCTVSELARWSVTTRTDWSFESRAI